MNEIISKLKPGNRVALLYNSNILVGEVKRIGNTILSINGDYKIQNPNKYNIDLIPIGTKLLYIDNIKHISIID